MNHIQLENNLAFIDALPSCSFIAHNNIYAKDYTCQLRFGNEGSKVEIIKKHETFDGAINLACSAAKQLLGQGAAALLFPALEHKEPEDAQIIEDDVPF